MPDADDPIVAESTDRILALVGDLTAHLPSPGIPSRAVVIYEILTEEGEAAVNYVATSSMVSTDVLGFVRFAEEAAIASLLYPDVDE